MSQPDDDLRDVRAEEVFGKGRHHRITPRQRARVLRAFRKALQEGDERLFLEAIRRDLGLQDDSPEFVRAFEIWRNFQKKKPSTASPRRP